MDYYDDIDIWDLELDEDFLALLDDPDLLQLEEDVDEDDHVWA